jgi:hypothetical protein
MTRRDWLALAPGAAWAAEPKAAQAELLVPAWTNGGGELAASVNGAAGKVRGVLGPESDLLILLVLDLAGDLATADPARRALVSAIEGLPENAWVAVMRSQDGLRTVADPAAEREPAVTAIQTMGISGRAGLLDTVETAAELAERLMERRTVRVAVLYVTDSSISNYREDYTNPVVNSSDGRDMSRRFPEGLVKEKIRQLEARLSAKQAPVFIVHLDYRSDRLNEAYQTGLITLASATGGTAAFCRSLAEIPSAIEGAFASIRSMSLVTVELKPGKAKQVDVTLTAAGEPLRHRTRYLMKGR